LEGVSRVKIQQESKPCKEANSMSTKQSKQKLRGYSKKSLFLVLLTTVCFCGSIFQFTSSYAADYTANPVSSEPLKTETTKSNDMILKPSEPLKPNETLKPNEALKRLMEGNKRFTEDKPTCPERNQVRRAATVAAQRPFAIVLGCSDSRVPPEIAFDQGIGDIFVVRVAGNIVSPVELSSVEYSALVNDSSIIVVLGHENCGAVTAVLENKAQGIAPIATVIRKGLDRFNPKKQKMDLQTAIEDNVRNSVMLIKQSSNIDKLIRAGKLMVVGAYYDLKTGAVRILDTETSLVAAKTLTETPTKTSTKTSK
jgi:carbonic anhydrase